MEEKRSHPIPQNVTGFQFRLIGDMTVKQFAYLAGPIFLAWLFFQLPFPLLIKVPVSLVLAAIGGSLAFLPIAGRPMDVMITNFIKALFRSTLYVYKKKGMHSLAPTATLSQKVTMQKEKVHEPHLQQKSGVIQTPPAPQPAPQTAPAYPPPTSPKQAAPKHPTVQQAPKTEQPPQDKNEALKKRPSDLENIQDVPKKEEGKEPLKETSGLQDQLQAVLAQKEQLTKQLMSLQQKLEKKKEDFFAPSVAKDQSADKAKPRIQTQHVRQVPRSLGKSVGLPTTPDAPNVITGIIKDPRENPLGNILVEIKDAEGNPVRAFKTNGLGQFASATPLTNGVYTISFDDPKGQNKFDAIEFSANNEVILPLEVISVDTREELRKTLFKDN